MTAWGLALFIGALCGALSLWAFRRWTNAESLRTAANRVWAHLLEFHLFADEPALILRAQRDLLAANGRFLKLMIKPLLLLALPVAVLVAAGDALVGHAPLRVGQSTVVTVQCRMAADHGVLPEMHLIVPAGMKVETPSVRIPSEAQISWRVSASHPISGKFEIGFDHRSVAKSIAVGSGLHWLSEIRTNAWKAVLHPFERPLGDSLVESVTIRYPAATIFSVSWFVWFVTGSLLGAGLLWLLSGSLRANTVAVGCLLLAGALHGETVSPLLARGYTVMPEPQRVTLEGEDFSLGSGWRLEASQGKTDAAAQETLREELGSRYHFEFATGGSGPAVVLETRPNAVEPGPSQDQDRASIAEQAYRIQLRPAQIHIVGNSAAGLFYGVQTFIQLLKSRDGALWLPAGDIVDWPDLGQRQIYWDDAHHLEKLDDLKSAVRQASFFKINGFIIKLEGHFEYEHAKAVVEPQALSPTEFQDLTNYGLHYHVQVIPYLDAPAHIAFILKHPEYAKLREFPDSNYEACETNPETLKLFYGMYDDLLAANRGVKYFYLSTDEAYYAGLADNAGCHEAQRAKELGSPGKVLAEFVTKAAGYLHDRGRSVVFWGEYPLKPGDIASLPKYLINGETYGPKFDAAFRQRGIRQMIYTSTEGEERLFPQYFLLPASRRLHPVQENGQRVPEAIANISANTGRKDADLVGVIVAGWGDMGLHPETFWLGYATIAAAGWKPWTTDAGEAMSAFYPLYYGPEVADMGRLYQLMSQQAQTWMDSWDWVDSHSRKPIWGNSYEIFAHPQPAHDQVIELPSTPDDDLRYAGNWQPDNEKRLRLAGDALADNDELLSLLNANLRLATANRHGLAVFSSIAQLCRQNLDFLTGLQQMDEALRGAGKDAAEGKAERALEDADKALAEARELQAGRNRVLRDTTATWYEDWLPRVEEANGRRFLHELDDVKDHLPDRTIDMSYLVYRELMLPMDEWYSKTQAARNAYAAAHHLTSRTVPLNWKSLN